MHDSLIQTCLLPFLNNLITHWEWQDNGYSTRGYWVINVSVSDHWGLTARPHCAGMRSLRNNSALKQRGHSRKKQVPLWSRVTQSYPQGAVGEGVAVVGSGFRRFWPFQSELWWAEKRRMPWRGNNCQWRFVGILRTAHTVGKVSLWWGRPSQLTHRIEVCRRTACAEKWSLLQMTQLCFKIGLLTPLCAI